MKLWCITLLFGALVLHAGEPDISYLTDPESLTQSVHQDLDCTDCHEDVSDDGLQAGEVDCTSCHDEAFEILEESTHSVECQACHGAHDIRPLDLNTSRVSKRRVSESCAPCHTEQASAYLGDVHGVSLVAEGTIVSPSCVDCHGGHDIPSIESNRDAPAFVLKMCGQCHSGLVDIYESSLHGQLALDGDADAPTCVSCHGAHGMLPALNSSKQAADQACGSCHQKRFEQHRHTYHGRVEALGDQNVAACFDCHGAHDIGMEGLPNPISGTQKIRTCRQCHHDAPDGFAAYLAHGDPDDRSSFPLLFWSSKATHLLILAAFAFLVLHTLAWNIKGGREQSPMVRGLIPGSYRKIDQFCYITLACAFALLALSGLPLKFYDQAWAQQAFALLGGREIAAGIHRLGSVLVLFVLAIHIGSLIAPLWFRQKFAPGRSLRSGLFAPHSPLPGRDDFISLWRHLRWMTGRGARPVTEGLYYWEKFDYLALILGISILVVSGLAMWQPYLMTLILPGWVLNVSSIIHSNEALLALLFFGVIHLTHTVNVRDRRTDPTKLWD